MEVTFRTILHIVSLRCSKARCFPTEIESMVFFHNKSFQLQEKLSCIGAVLISVDLSSNKWEFSLRCIKLDPLLPKSRMNIRGKRGWPDVDAMLKILRYEDDTKLGGRKFVFMSA